MLSLCMEFNWSYAEFCLLLKLALASIVLSVNCTLWFNAIQIDELNIFSDWASHFKCMYEDEYETGEWQLFPSKDSGWSLIWRNCDCFAQNPSETDWTSSCT